jgi:hypothetical protein
MTTSRPNREQYMDQWQIGKDESRYLAYLQLVEHVLERLVFWTNGFKQRPK